MNNKDATTKPEFTYAALRLNLSTEADDIASSLISFIHDVYEEANLENLGYELIEMDEADLEDLDDTNSLDYAQKKSNKRFYQTIDG